MKVLTIGLIILGLFPLCSNAQRIQFFGSIKDSKSSLVTRNAEGRFLICSNDQEKLTIVTSCIGHKTATIELDKDNTSGLKIYLEQDTKREFSDTIKS